MKYERLTERVNKGKVKFILTKGENPIEKFQNALDRLAELEDKIEQGTLIELPCKVGDTVYEVFKEHRPPFIKETTIEKIVITAKGLRLRLARNSFYETAISSLGKTVFFTREEAEKKLKESQE